jgi:hypothetical protein
MSDQKNFASESGHWYDKDGNPAYTVPYADPSKGERSTTLRDARKFGFFPSVTTVMGVCAKPGLERWKVNNAIDSALTLPVKDGESLDAYKQRVIIDAQEQASKAAELGTEIHGALENYFRTGTVHANYEKIITATDFAISEAFPECRGEAERSFTSRDHGYGGKVDFCSFDKELVIDFKTKEFGEDDKRIHWPEQVYQLAAYAEGLGMDLDVVTLANVFVSVNNPGLVKIHIWKTDHRQDFRTFKMMLELWKCLKDYDPSAAFKSF